MHGEVIGMSPEKLGMLGCVVQYVSETFKSEGAPIMQREHCILSVC